ncbi:hypothetical protein I6F07_07940 [Ensifer sp. IC4062]|nr:hypothetical protein [Ensifer sp. IC4062]MCA1440150.1 hypothetical protein [Ensifer sp. IC4062]
MIYPSLGGACGIILLLANLDHKIRDAVSKLLGYLLQHALAGRIGPELLAVETTGFGDQGLV